MSGQNLRQTAEFPSCLSLLYQCSFFVLGKAEAYLTVFVILTGIFLAAIATIPRTGTIVVVIVTKAITLKFWTSALSGCFLALLGTVFAFAFFAEFEL